MLGFFYDYYYVVLVIPALIVAVIARIKVKSTFDKYAGIRNTRGVSGARAARETLARYGVFDVKIEETPGILTDHYDPKSKTIRLSGAVYSGTSISAVGTACHEAGHAAQHAENYIPIKVRNSLIPVCNVGSALGLPLALFGYFFSFRPLIATGLLLYAAIVLFQVVTLPVEFDASRRAIKAIDETGLLYDEEIAGAKKVLTAAAMTYVASTLVALANLLRLVLRFNARNRG